MTNDLIKLPNKLCTVFGKHFFIKRVPGDNSCFYHSILYLVSDKYRKLDNVKDKSKMCEDFRVMLCSKLSKNNYRKYKGFVSYNDMKTSLLNYNVWAGNIEWKFVCDQLKLNLFIFRYEHDDVYRGWGLDNFNPKYHTICIMNLGGIHYDPIVFCKNSKIKTKMGIDSIIVNKIMDLHKKKM